MYSRQFAIQVASVLVATVSTAWAQTLYWGGGTADVADNTAFPTNTSNFCGKWNLTTHNWASTNAPGVFNAYVNGSVVDLGYVINPNNGGVVAITNESDVSLSGLMCVSSGPGSTYNQMIYLTATNSRTLTFTGTNFLLNAFGTENSRGLQVETNVSLAGTAPVSSVAVSGRFIVKSISPNLTGPVTVRNSNFLIDTGALPGVPSWDLRTQLFLQGSGQKHSYPRFSVNRLSLAAMDQLNDSATVSLAFSQFTYKGWDHASTPSGETIGKIVLEPYGVLEVSALGGGIVGTPRPALRLADAEKGIDRGTSGTGMLTVLVPSGNNTGIEIGVPASDIVVSNGVITEVLLPWISTSQAEFMKLNGTTKVLERIPSTWAPEDLSTWVAGSDYRVGTNTLWTSVASITNDLSINSLGICATNNLLITIDSGKTLTLASGGLSQMANASTANNKMFIITNGMLTSGSGTLYVHKATDAYHGNLVIASSITGNGMDLIKAGLGELFLRGPDSNTYSGTTYVCGPMTADKSGSAVAVSGNLVIQNGGLFNANGTAPISSTSALTINTGGVWNHGVSGTFTHGGRVTLNGGCYYLQAASPVFAGSGTGLLFSAGGRITQYSSSPGSASIQTTVGYASGATGQARWERLRDAVFSVELDGAQRTFDIADSSTLAVGVPEMVMDTVIVPGTPAGGSLRKTGAGVLQLTDTNTFTGGTVIDGGTIQVSTISAPAQSKLTASFMASPNLITFNQPVARSMVVRQRIGSTSNTGFTDKRFITEILNEYQIITEAVGAVGRPTDVYVEAISRSGTLGTGAVTVNNTGTLKLDPGIGLTNAVIVYAGGTIAASGAGIGSLVINGGTFSVEPSTGALSVSNTVSLTSATLYVSGVLGSEEQAVLTAGSSLTGTFATVSGLPANYRIIYTAKQASIKKISGTFVSFF